MLKQFLSLQKNRSMVVTFGFVAITVLFAWHLVYYGAVLPGINEKGDAVKEAIADREERARTIEGSIVDANGDVITHAEKANESAKCFYVSYSQLVGFNNARYGSYGLRKRYADDLFTGDKKHQGATLKLTTINKVQNAAYDAIKGTDGCVVVMENATGRIIALATAKPGVEMDVNDLDSNWDEMMATTGFLQQNWLVGLAPGSVMKPLTSTVVYEQGRAEETYHDTGTERIQGYEFHNAGGGVNGDTNLKKAIVKSCNTYFAHMTDQMGGYLLQERAEAFGIGQDLELDFATISSSHNLDQSNRVETAAAGFGQGKLMMTPINIALIGQTIANGGEMVRPYLIDSIYREKRVSYKGKTESLGQVCSKEAADYVSDAMKAAAVSYGIDKSLGIHAKTGTADLPGGKNRASFLSFNDKYTVCIVENYTGKAGKSHVKAAVKIYQVLNELA